MNAVTQAFLDLDRILRGEVTRHDRLEAGSLGLRLTRLSVLLILLAALYGICMGAFSLMKEGGPSWEQVLASTMKIPALFSLTLAITFPSLYVFGALVGSPLRVKSMLQLLVASQAIMITVAASLGPIVAFFGASTSSYSFMVLLNVVVLGLAGFLGLGFLVQTMHRLIDVVEVERKSEGSPEASQEGQVEHHEDSSSHHHVGPLEHLPADSMSDRVRILFGTWLIVFGLVGAQMGWVLRPFIGDPSLPFTWFRPRHSNFFEAVLNALWSLMVHG